MGESKDSIMDYGPSGEAKLRAFVEQVTGGRVVRFDRQVRWRPAWFVDVERGSETLRLHLRGDRQSDVVPFPELKREADVMSVLWEHGIPVPRIYGYCVEPPVIVMEALAGSRDLAEASDDAERATITREYIRAVAAMHALPVAPFIERGITPARSAEEISLAALNAYTPLYRKTKKKPEPLIEFAIAWIKRNIPVHRTEASFVQLDSGQFLFAGGRMTGLYDFEFSMIGDPMVDLATMRMRDSYEWLGEDMRTLCRHYEEFSGNPVDHAVVLFHTLQFTTVAMMQIAGTVAVPQPADPHAVYLEWNVALRRVLILAFCECLGITVPPEPAPAEQASVVTPLIDMLADALSRIETTTEIQGAQKNGAIEVAECLVRAGKVGTELEMRNIRDVNTLLGRNFSNWEDAESALEQYVQMAPPEQDETLLRLFAAQEERRFILYGPTQVGRAATRVRLPPTC